MREISCNLISEKVAQLCIDANCYLNDDIRGLLENGKCSEISENGKDVLDQILRNADIAKNESMPICQDTGMAVIFVEIGQEVHIVDGNLTNAINSGVEHGYKNGYMRKSVVADPLIRENTGNNTPAIIHYEVVEGDSLKISIMPKGFGSENMGGVKMLKPSDGVNGVIDFIVQTVSTAGANPCPPIVVGVGIGGTMEKAAILSKKALLRHAGEHSKLKHIEEIEAEVLKRINNLGIGPAGVGGMCTALAVSIESFPTHIAGLPVAVTINCHATRHTEFVF